MLKSIMALARMHFKEYNIYKSNFYLFTLNKITGCKGYVKHFLKESNFEFKCIDSLMFPFVIRAIRDEEVTESDCMFMNEGLLSKFIEIPQINIEW